MPDLADRATRRVTQRSPAFECVTHCRASADAHKRSAQPCTLRSKFYALLIFNNLLGGFLHVQRAHRR